MGLWTWIDARGAATTLGDRHEDEEAKARLPFAPLPTRKDAGWAVGGQAGAGGGTCTAHQGQGHTDTRTAGADGAG